MLAALAAGEALPPALAEAEALLIVRDGRWLQEQAAALAAAAGRDPSELRAHLAAWCFRSRGLEGLDLSRPAIVAWRPGPSPFAAVLPVGDRQRFLAEFGAVPQGEPPLVRTGEREGTVIYRQNQGGTEWEYRLFVARHAAALARSAEEARRLAELPLAALAGGGPPLELQLRRPQALARVLPLSGGRWPFLPLPDAGLAGLAGPVLQAADGLADELPRLVLAAEGDAGRLRLRARAEPRAGGALAAWLAAQRPGSERLSAQLSGDDLALLAVGRFAFQGELERWLVAQAGAVRAAAGAGWNEVAEDAYRALGLLVERSGAIALGIAADADGTWRFAVVEHPRAAEFAHAWAQVAAALQRQPLAVDAADGTTRLRVGAERYAAGARHALWVDGGAAADARVARLLERLERPAGAVDGEPALLALRADLARCLATPPRGHRPLPFWLRLQMAGPEQPALAVELPLLDLARLLAGEGARDE